MAKETIKTVSLEKPLKVYEQDLTYQFGVDGTAQYVMECLEDKVSPKLLDVLNAKSKASGCTQRNVAWLQRRHAVGDSRRLAGLRLRTSGSHDWLSLG